MGQSYWINKKCLCVQAQYLQINNNDKFTNDPYHEKGIFRAYADCEGPDQTAHTRSLIRAFAFRLQDRWIFNSLFRLYRFADHYENTPIQLYRKFYNKKRKIFRLKKI